MTVLSIDLAHKRYQDVGVCLLERRGSRLHVTPVKLIDLGLSDEPANEPLARAIADLAAHSNARSLFIDGPQAWKDPSNGIEHSRICERALRTPGKTGLPGITKPGNYAPFIAFSIELFDRLANLGWPRLQSASAAATPGRFAIESFPTSAWRSLRLSPLPGKAKTPPSALPAKLLELASIYPLDAPGDLTHDELQAVVAGLAGIVMDERGSGHEVVGAPPFELDGTWREGFIVNPTRTLASRELASS